MRSLWEIAEAGKDIGGKCGLRPNLIRKAPQASNRDSARVTSFAAMFAKGLRPLEA